MSSTPNSAVIPVDTVHRHSEHSHGVCWPAVFAGATGAAVLTLVLLLLGTGIGVSAISPWTGQGASSTTVSVSEIIWMSVVQIVASIMGGYLAGRLRQKWDGLHSHEAYFRDTAHGFLAWAVATLVMASLLSSVVGTVAGYGLKAGASAVGRAPTIAGADAAGNTALNSMSGDSISYFTDSMLRAGPGPLAAASPGTPTPTSAEVGRIFFISLRSGTLSPADSQYLTQLVAQRTGLSPGDAQKRVNDTFAQAQQAIQDAQTQAQAAADAVRKASAELALWLVVSLLIGAFSASWAATLGGRLRDGLGAIGPERK